MKSIKILFKILILLIFILGSAGCDKKKEAKVEDKKHEISGPKKAEGPNVESSEKPVTYLRLEGGDPLLFLNLALSTEPIDYKWATKMLGGFTDSKKSKDVFKQNEIDNKILEDYKQRIDEGVKNAKSNRYFILSMTKNAGVFFEHYNMANKCFAIKRESSNKEFGYGIIEIGDNYDSKIYIEKFSDNIHIDSGNIHVDNPDVARKIEGFITENKKITISIYLYIYDSYTQGDMRFSANALKVAITDTNGNDLLNN